MILTADEYVATFACDPSLETIDAEARPRDELPPGKAVSVHLYDGRSVPAVAVGSDLDWGFGLIKITQEGHWPDAKIGDTDKMTPGAPCFALGYRSPVIRPRP